MEFWYGSKGSLLAKCNGVTFHGLIGTYYYTLLIVHNNGLRRKTIAMVAGFLAYMMPKGGYGYYGTR